MRYVAIAMAAAASIMLSACGGNKLADYKDMTPVMHFDQFFNGPVKGYGIVQDRGGKVIKRFDVDMFGRWNGNEGVLEEHFVYYDGKITDRAWHIRKLADESFVATASDIVGEASGESRGSAIAWDYVMQVPADNGKTYDIRFDDWMYQMHDDIVLNRNNMSKFGVGIGSLSIVMHKQPAGTPNAAEALHK